MSSLSLEYLAFGPGQVLPDSDTYRPSTWPPSAKWVVSASKDGDPISKFSDSRWSFSHLAGRPLNLHFQDDAEYSARSPDNCIDKENGEFLRRLTTWLIWGPRSDRAWLTIYNAFKLLRTIFKICSRNGIQAHQLHRFPGIWKLIVNDLKNRGKGLIPVLKQFYIDRSEIGFCIADPSQIKSLADAIETPELQQTPCIPPRIYEAFINRIRECLDDFLFEQEKIDDLFNTVLSAYASAFGGLDAAMESRNRVDNQALPFSFARLHPNFRQNYQGPFAEILSEFGLLELLKKWIVTNDPPRLEDFSAYLTLVREAARAYLINYSLQRVSETGYVRADGLRQEVNEHIGIVPILHGATSKTIRDGDARWVCGPGAALAVQVAQRISKLRIQCAVALPGLDLSPVDTSNPYLFDRSYEPWIPMSSKERDIRVRPIIRSLDTIVSGNPRAFGLDDFIISPEDLRAAIKLTPSVADDPDFRVGRPWVFAWHQLRRTGAVAMLSSGDVSEESLQYQLKHRTPIMTAYYGRGFSAFRLNFDAEKLVFQTVYERMDRAQAAARDIQFSSPYGQRRKDAIVVQLIAPKDYKAFTKAASDGKLYFRKIRLGACTSRISCPYGGVETYAHCTGEDTGSPCNDALFDSAKRASVLEEIEMIGNELQMTDPQSPKARSLLRDQNSLRKFINVVG